MHSDTTNNANHMQRAAWRRLDGVSRLKQALDLSEAVRLLANQGARDRAQEGREAPRPGAS